MSLRSKVNFVKKKKFYAKGGATALTTLPLCRFATRRVGTHAGKDLSRFSRSSNVTRLARLQVGDGGQERGRQTGSVKTGAGGEGEREEERQLG